jgi:hypothetical protein
VSLPSRLLGANPSIQVSTLLSGSLSTPSAKGAFTVGNFFSIATETIGGSSSSTVTFSNVPSTYTHLQIRMISTGTRADYAIGEINIQFNGDTGNNYAYHDFYGDGAAGTLYTSYGTTQSSIRQAPGTFGGTTGGNTRFGSAIIDIFDYSDSNKYTTVRGLSALDLNGTINGLGGRVGFASGSWRNTSTVTSITITASGASPFLQYSKFALYGIKAAA